MGNHFLETEPVVLRRPPENSPNATPSHWEEPVLEFRTYPCRSEELKALAGEVRRNLSLDGLVAAREILVVVLGTGRDGRNLERETAEFLLRSGVDVFVPSALRLNDLRPRYPSNDPDRFWHDGGVTVSGIHRAKGNEAEMVHVVGLDKVAEREGDEKARNQLFAALTRSRSWARLTGVGSHPFYDEVRRVLESGDTFRFAREGGIRGFFKSLFG